jgi:hypothetical protein
MSPNSALPRAVIGSECKAEREVASNHSNSASFRVSGSATSGPRVAPAPSADATKSGRVEELIQLLRGRSYAEIRQRMYDSAPGSPWWAACKAELELRNGQQVAEASLVMSRVSEKMRASTQHFEQLADTLHQATQDLADLLRGTQDAGRRLEIAVYVTIGITLVQLFNLVFEIFRRR